MKRGEEAGAREDALSRARELYAARAWQVAYEAFSALEAAAPLDADDLDLLTACANLAGHVPESLRHAERLYEARLARGEELLAARTAFFLALRLLSLGEPARAGGWMGRAQALAEGKDCCERGFILLTTLRKHETTGDLPTAMAAAEEAQTLGDRFGDADLSAFARSMRGSLLARNGHVDRGLGLIDEAMVAAVSGKLSPIVTGLTYCAAIAGCQQVFALDRGREWTLALSSWCEEQPQLVVFTGRCLVHRSELLQLGGDWGLALGEAQRIAEAAKRTDPGTAGDALYQEAEIHRLRGEHAAAEQCYRAASEQGREPHPGLALLWLAAGRGEVAAAALRRVLASTARPLQRAQFLPATVEVMAAVGALEEAEAATRELEDIAARFGTDVLGAMAAHARGTVALREGRAEEALVPLRRAFTLWRQLGIPYLAARVRLLTADACEALDDKETARWERELAAEVLQRLGATPRPSGVEGAEPPASDSARLGPAASSAPPTSEPPCGLSPRELQVLRLVAAGKTNKTIAKELFLSEKTVDRHLSNIFTKIDVASRAAATAFAYQHRLV